MGQLKICLSIYGTTESICEALIKSDADLFEIRLDLSSGLDFAQIRASTSKSIIFTSHSRPSLLKTAAPYANYMDIGPEKLLGPEYIVSIHADSGDPAELWKEYSGDHLTKIVLNTEDYSTISNLIRLNREHHPSAICFAMGETGAFSRILSVIEGAPWIYSSLPGQPTAPGQFTIDELVQLYRIKRFSSKPSIFGILGNPVSHSRSPKFHNSRFAAENLNWIYLPFPCKNVDSFMKHAPEFGICGLSVTHPYKESVLPFLKKSSEEVKMLRSCNTMFFENGGWTGINTDTLGIEEIFKRECIKIDDARVTILGAGGAARAAAFAAKKHTNHLTFLNRTISRARELASEFGGIHGSLQEFGSNRCDVLIQATSAGMKPEELPVDPSKLHPETIVIDAIYEPAETALLRNARKIGCKTINGRIWFEAQAEQQFQWWKKMTGAIDKSKMD